jgi:hypothetical protein
MLQDRTAAAVMVVHDLLALAGTGNVGGQSLAIAVNATGGWISAEWPLGIGRVTVPWPEPEWSTFREFDLFARLWDGVCRGIQRQHGRVSGPERAEIFAQGFLKCMLDAVGGKWEPPTDIPRAFGQKTWSSLKSGLEHLLESPPEGGQRQPLRTLPITLACVLAPEAAIFLPTNAVRGLADVLAKTWSQPWCKAAIRAARAERAKRFYAAGAGDLAERLLAPKSYERRLHKGMDSGRRLLAQLREDRGIASRPVPTIVGDDPRSWLHVIESLLSGFDTIPTPRKRRSRAKSVGAPTEWDRDLPETLAFLRDALDGFRGEFLASLDHPINNVFGGDLCPRPKDLQRVEAGTAASPAG